MMPLVAVLILVAVFALLALTRAISTLGLAGLLDQIAAMLISAADAWRHAKEVYSRNLEENRRWAAARRD